MTDTPQVLADALLTAARKAGADAAESILVQGTSLSIDVRNGALEMAERSEATDLGLRVFIGKRSAITSASDSSAATIEAMAERARDLEAKLSDALHHALKQRFVDRRSSFLFRNMGTSARAPKVSLDAEGMVLVDDEVIGSMSGFRFDDSPAARGAERRMLLAAAEKYLGGIMGDKAKAVAEAADDAFTVERDDAGAPVLSCAGTRIGRLVRGNGLLSPRLEFDVATSDLAAADRDAMRARAEAWIAGEIEKSLGGLVAMEKEANLAETPGELRALAVQLIDAAGAQRRKALGDVLRGFSRELRAAGRRLGLVFGAPDIYHFQAFKPRACWWRDLLHALWHSHDMQDMPPDSAVHLADWNFRDDDAARLAGYTRAGSEWLRIDLAERLIRQAHEARGEKQQFEMGLDYPTSLGLSEASFAALLGRAGFQRIEPPMVIEEAAPAEAEAPPPADTASETLEATADESATAASEESPAAEPDATPTQPALGSIWLEWGTRAQRPRRASAPKRGKPKKGQKTDRAQKAKGDRPNVRPPAPPSARSALAEALGEQLAALKDKN